MINLPNLFPGKKKERISIRRTKIWFLLCSHWYLFDFLKAKIKYIYVYKYCSFYCLVNRIIYDQFWSPNQEIKEMIKLCRYLWKICAKSMQAGQWTTWRDPTSSCWSMCSYGKSPSTALPLAGSTASTLQPLPLSTPSN